MAPKAPQPSREAQMIAGLDAFQETIRERDEALTEATSLKRAFTDAQGQNVALREVVSKLLADRDLLTAALSTANAQMRTVHACMRDMATATEKAVESAKEIDLSGAGAMARRLAPPAKAQPTAEEFRATLADRLVAVDQNKGARA